MSALKIWDGTQWVYVPTAPVPDTGWIAPTLGTGWTNYGSGYNPIGYRKMAGVVHLRGMANQSGALSNVLFTLPAGMVPGFISLLPIYAASAITGAASTGTAHTHLGNNQGWGGCLLQIGTDGNLTVIGATASWVNIDGVSFAP